MAESATTPLYEKEIASLRADRARLEQEVGRLREALDTIAGFADRYDPDTDDYTEFSDYEHGYQEAGSFARSIAQAALQGSTDNG